MFKLAFIGIVVIIIISAFIIIIRNKPEPWFWLFLNLYFDPGGYITGFMGGNILGPLNAKDFFIAGMVMCMFFARINLKVILQDQFLSRFLLYFFLYTIYYFIVYGGVVPFFYDDLNYSTFLLKNRYFGYGFIILLSVYLFSLKGLYYFYTITLFIGVICLSLFFVTLITGIELIPVWEFERTPGEEAMRVSMLSYGIFYLLFPISLITYVINRKINLNINYTNLLYYGGTVMIITMLITLTKRLQLDIIGSIILIVLIISYLFRTGKLSSALKIILPASMIVILIYLSFPDYGTYIADTAEDTFLLLTTGQDSRGQSDTRVTGAGDYELVKEYIQKNLFFGLGYSYMTWDIGNKTSTRGDTFARVRDAAGEVPIYLLFFSFGLAGAVLILSLYFLLAKLFFNLIKLLKLTLLDHLHEPLTIIFSIYFLLIIAKMFTYQIWGLGDGFFIASISNTAVLAGLGFALYRKIFLNYKVQSFNR